MIGFKVEGMRCGHCVGSITKAIKRCDPSARVEIDLDAGKVWVESVVEPAKLTQAIAEAGYAIRMQEQLRSFKAEGALT